MLEKGVEKMEIEGENHRDESTEDRERDEKIKMCKTGKGENHRDESTEDREGDEKIRMCKTGKGENHRDK